MTSRKTRIGNIFNSLSVIQKEMIRNSRPDSWSTQWNKADKHGLTLAQRMLLINVKARQPVNVKQLAQSMNVSKSAVSQIIDPLVKRGMLERFQDQEDRRVSFVSLAPAYAEEMKSILQLVNPSVSAMFEVFDKSEVIEFERLSGKLAESLNE